jgi:hypothetical protein
VTGPVFLGSQQVCRSAHAEQTATALTIYLGICERHNRPVRFEYPAGMGPAADIPCPGMHPAGQRRAAACGNHDADRPPSCASAAPTWTPTRAGLLTPADWGHGPFDWRTGSASRCIGPATWTTARDGRHRLASRPRHLARPPSPLTVLPSAPPQGAAS